MSISAGNDDPDDPVVVTGRRATRTRPLSPAQKQANQLISRERAPAEHGFADLKNWRILTKVRMSAANLALRGGVDHLTAIMKSHPKRMQHRPALLDSLIAETGLTLEPP